MQNQLAFTCYRRVNNVDGCASIKEKHGDYNGVVKFYLDNKLLLKAITRAHQYESQGISLKYDASALHLIRTYAARLSQRELLKVLKYVPLVAERVQVFKERGYYADACKLLCEHQEYDEAYRVFSAQGMYKEAIELATQSRNDTLRATFILQLAVAGLAGNEDFSSGQYTSMNIRSELQHICKSGQPSQQAKAFLLCGLLDGSAELCGRAVTRCKSNQHKTGELEAFNAQMELTRQAEAPTYPSLLEVLHACQSASEVIKSLGSEASSTSIRTLEDTEDFYNLQKHGSLYMYCIPADQILWIQGFGSCKATNAAPDRDGMLQLDIPKVYREIKQHLAKLTTSWLEIMNVKEKIVAMLIHFPFHQSLLHCGGFIKQSQRAIPIGTIQEYLRRCQLVVAFSEFESMLKGEVEAVLVNLFSPQAMVNLSVSKKHHMGFVRRSPPVKKFLEVHVRGQRDFTLDRWFTAWRLSTVVGDELHHMDTVLSKQAEQVQSEYKSFTGRGKFLAPRDYIYNKQEDRYSQVFSLWLKACRLIRKDCKVSTSMKILLHFFLRNVVNRQNFGDTISVMNVVDVGTMCTTGLLTLLTLCCAHQHEQHSPPVIVPHTFRHFVQTFDDFNCPQDADLFLLKACVQDVQTRNVKLLPRIYQESVDLLRFTLGALLGHYSKRQSILKYSVSDPSSLENGEAMYYLILTLTLFGNLALIGDCSEVELGDYYSALCTALQPLSTVDSELHRAFQMFRSIQGVHNIFEVVLFLLSRSDQHAHLLKIKVHTKKGVPVKTTFITTQLSQLPSRPLPSITKQNFGTHTVSVSNSTASPEEHTGETHHSSQDKTFPAVLSQRLPEGELLQGSESTHYSLPPASVSTGLSSASSSADDTTTDTSIYSTSQTMNFHEPPLSHTVHEHVHGVIHQEGHAGPSLTPHVGQSVYGFEQRQVQSDVLPEFQFGVWEQTTFKPDGVYALQQHLLHVDNNTMQAADSPEIDIEGDYDDLTLWSEISSALEDVHHVLTTQLSTGTSTELSGKVVPEPENVDVKMVDVSYCRFCAKHLQPPSALEPLVSPESPVTPTHATSLEGLATTELDFQGETYEFHCATDEHTQNVQIHQKFIEQLGKYQLLEEQLCKALEQCKDRPTLAHVYNIEQERLRSIQRKIRMFEQQADWRKGTHDIENAFLDHVHAAHVRVTTELQNAPSEQEAVLQEAGNTLEGQVVPAQEDGHQEELEEDIQEAAPRKRRPRGKKRRNRPHH